MQGLLSACCGPSKVFTARGMLASLANSDHGSPPLPLPPATWIKRECARKCLCRLSMPLQPHQRLPCAVVSLGPVGVRTLRQKHAGTQRALGARPRPVAILACCPAKRLPDSSHETAIMGLQMPGRGVAGGSMLPTLPPQPQQRSPAVAPAAAQHLPVPPSRAGHSDMQGCGWPVVLVVARVWRCSVAAAPARPCTCGAAQTGRCQARAR